MPKKKKSRFMKNLLIRIIGFLIITIGLIVLNYPYLSGILNEKVFAYQDQKEYQQIIENTDNHELEEKIQTARDYNDALSSGKGLVQYQDFELLNEGALLGYVEIPQIGVYGSVKYSVSNEVLKNGLGLIEETSLPVGGPSTHAVISGHTGMATKKGLTDLTQMQLGDIFFMHVLGMDMAYEVDSITVVEPWDASGLAIIDGEDHVTLLTCTPYGVNDHRLLVRGIRIDYDFSEPEIPQDEEPTDRISDVEQVQIYIAIGSVVVYVLFIAYLTVGIIQDLRYDAKKRKELENSESVVKEE